MFNVNLKDIPSEELWGEISRRHISSILIRELPEDIYCVSYSGHVVKCLGLAEYAHLAMREKVKQKMNLDGHFPTTILE